MLFLLMRMQPSLWYTAQIILMILDYIYNNIHMATGSLQSGDGDWAGGIVGLERNYEVRNHRQPCHTVIPFRKPLSS